MTHAVVLNPATRIVMNLLSYSAEYEDKSVDAPKDDSDDEYEKKDKRKLSDVLKDCKKKWVQHPDAGKLADEVLKGLEGAKVLLRMGDSDKLCCGKIWCKSNDIHKDLT